MGTTCKLCFKQQTSKMMIQIVVLALAATALAEPEADAGYYYGRYFNHHYYNRGLYGYGYGYPRYGYHGYHGLWKRDADAQVATPAATQLLPAALPAQAVTPFFTNPYVTSRCSHRSPGSHRLRHSRGRHHPDRQDHPR